MADCDFDGHAWRIVDSVRFGGSPGNILDSCKQFCVARSAASIYRRTPIECEFSGSKQCCDVDNDPGIHSPDFWGVGGDFAWFGVGIVAAAALGLAVDVVLAGLEFGHVVGELATLAPRIGMGGSFGGDRLIFGDCALSHLAAGAPSVWAIAPLAKPQTGQS